MPFDPNVPQAGQPLDATVVRNQLNALNDKIDGLPGPGAETDPLFAASEAALLEPGDKVNLDTALQDPAAFATAAQGALADTALQDPAAFATAAQGALADTALQDPAAFATAAQGALADTALQPGTTAEDIGALSVGSDAANVHFNSLVLAASLEAPKLTGAAVGAVAVTLIDAVPTDLGGSYARAYVLTGGAVVNNLNGFPVFVLAGHSYALYNNGAYWFLTDFAGNGLVNPSGQIQGTYGPAYGAWTGTVAVTGVTDETLFGAVVDGAGRPYATTSADLAEFVNSGGDPFIKASARVAASTSYTPGDSAQWAGDPATVAAALDRIAAALAGLLGAPIP